MNNKEINIVDHKRSKVFYNKSDGYYRKVLYPKLSDKIKYLFRIKRYPGNNYLFIREELKKIGIKSAKEISISKYEIVMEEVIGISVERAIETFNKEDREYIAKQYIDILRKLLESGIYAPDATLDNFLVNNLEIIAIDFETYKKTPFSFFKRGKMRTKTLKFLELKSNYKELGIDLIEMYTRSDNEKRMVK